LTFCFLCFSSFADGEMLLTADDAVKAALSNNLGFASEKINVVIKERSKDASWNVFIPKLSVGAALSRLNEPSNITYIQPIPPGVNNVYDNFYFQSITPPEFNISGSLNATLSLSVQQFYAIRQTYLDYESGKINYDTAEQKLDRDVRKSFYGLLLAEQSIKLMEKSIQSAKTRYDLATVNFNNGLVDQYTMLAAQVAYENMKPSLDELKNIYVTALLTFKLLIGVDLDKEVSLAGSLEDIKPIPLDDKALIDTYLDKRLDLQNLGYTLKSLENAQDLLRASLYPTITFLLSFDPVFTKDPFTNPWFADIDKDWMQRSGMFAISLNMSLDSLLPFSKTQTDIANAQSNVEKLKLSITQARNGAELEIRSLILKLHKSEESLSSLVLNVSLAEKANTMGQNAYKAGLKDYSQIEDTEFQMQNAQFNILKEKYNYISNLYDLSFALSTPIESIVK
jgi:outer membrane protein TolC